MSQYSISILREFQNHPTAGPYSRLSDPSAKPVDLHAYVGRSTSPKGGAKRQAEGDALPSRPLLSEAPATPPLAPRGTRPPRVLTASEPRRPGKRPREEGASLDTPGHDAGPSKTTIRRTAPAPTPISPDLSSPSRNSPISCLAPPSRTPAHPEPPAPDLAPLVAAAPTSARTALLRTLRQSRPG